MSAVAMGWAGTRTPTVSRPPVISSRTPAARCTMTVKGPGHAASASRRADSGIDAAQSTRSRPEAMWTISGWSAGRPLTVKIRRMAAGFVASAANP